MRTLPISKVSRIVHGGGTLCNVPGLCEWRSSTGENDSHATELTRSLCEFRSLQIMKEDDANWPEPDRVGRQELEIVMGNEHISFTTSKIGELKRPR